MKITARTRRTAHAVSTLNRRRRNDERFYGGPRRICWVGPDTPFERTIRPDPTDLSRVIVTDTYAGPWA